MNSKADEKKYISFEFFPPKSDEGRGKLKKTISDLGQLNPLYFSVTYGAGGSTQQGTFETVDDVQSAGYEVAPHLSCIGSSKETISEILQTYMDKGIKRLVALRGDLPSGMRGDGGEFRYANELVEFVRQETGDHFYIEVAAYPEIHPQAASASQDLENFARKVRAGSDAAITQYFYNTDSYFHFLDECAAIGIDIPIVPGVMPITNYDQLSHFSDLCGAEIPRWIRKRLEGYGDDKAALYDFGMDVTIDLCRKLIDGGAPGLHIFTMNQAGPAETICKALDI